MSRDMPKLAIYPSIRGISSIHPSRSVVSTMFCKAKSVKKKKNIYAPILDHFITKMFNSETNSFQLFSPSGASKYTT